MNCKNCPFYTLEEVPVLDDDLQPISGQFTKARMCTAGDDDFCFAEADFAALKEHQEFEVEVGRHRAGA